MTTTSSGSSRRARKAWVAALLVAILATPSLVWAVEYRLRVANLHDSAYFHFATSDGGPSDSPYALPGLVPALTSGTLGTGVFVPSRSLVAADGPTARSLNAVEARPVGDASQRGQWLEVRWEGRPGQRAVWVVRGEGIFQPAVVGVGLPAQNGQFRHFIPLALAPGAWRLRAARIGLDFIDFWYGREGLWRRHLGPRLDLGRGIAAVVGENPNSVYSDAVFLVIEQPSTPTTWDVVIAWRHRERGRVNPYFEGPGVDGSEPSVR